MGMTIFDDPSPQAMALADLRQNMRKGLDDLRNSFYASQAIFWQNRRGLSPQEMFDLVAAEAPQFIEISEATIAFINRFSPEKKQVASLKPDGATLKIDDSGRVVVTIEQAPTEP